VSKDDELDVDSIQVLEGLEAVRKRPEMYVGDTSDGSGRDHLIWEVVANSIDQHLMRRARSLFVSIADGWVVVEDDGPGLPCGELHGKNAIEIIFTTLHAGATWDGHVPHVHVSFLRGVGVTSVNALSERLEVETCSGGTRWRMAFEHGRVVEPLSSGNATNDYGTRIRFRPDRAIFHESPAVDCATIERRLRELAWMNPLLDLRFQGQKLPWRGGVAGWVREIAGTLVGDVVVTAARVIDEVFVDVALGWRASTASSAEIRSFAGQCATPLGGTHVDGLWDAISLATERLGPPDLSPELRRERLAGGLVAVVHVAFDVPQFGEATRGRLDNPAAAAATARVGREALFARCRTEQASALAADLARRLRG
jgi:DNA gyrase subunit B